MKWTLMWLCVSLSAATSLKTTGHVTASVLLQNPPAHNNNDGNEINSNQEAVLVKSTEDLDAHIVDNKNGNEETNTISEEAVESPSEESVLEPEGTDNGDVPDEVVKYRTVLTTYGLVQGFREKLGNRISFFDIPYGRFMNTFEAPTNPRNWTNPLENTKHTVQCPQLDGDTYKGDLNCLTLSVFTSDDAANASVLFYIHDSEFSTGSGDPAVYRPDNLVNRGVILVLPNYRLGPLGFLCLQNSTAPGNAALKDLTLALEWTTRNIKEFGGDPTNIAVSGDGASAALAGYLALSPTSRHYISKVISDSGTALSHWAIDRRPVDSAERLADLIRTDAKKDTNSDDLFKELDAEKLIQSAKGITLRPCIEQEREGSFITATPWKILYNETIDISFIIGTANHAGLLQALKHDDASISELNERFTNILPDDLSFENTKQMNNIGLNLKAQYFGEDNITLDQYEELSLYHTDASYLGPSLRMARALVEAGARVFMYEFSFVGALNTKLTSLVDPPNYGAVRGDIIGYLFPEIIPQAASFRSDKVDQNDDSAETRVVDLIADLWISFLKTGTPSAGGIDWHPLNDTADSSEDYLSIGNETRPTHGVHPERLRLWSDIYRQHFVDRNSSFGKAAAHFLVASAMLLVGVLKTLVG